jgi:hypothetical protein
VFDWKEGVSITEIFKADPRFSVPSNGIGDGAIS